MNTKEFTAQDSRKILLKFFFEEGKRDAKAGKVHTNFHTNKLQLTSFGVECATRYVDGVRIAKGCIPDLETTMPRK